ncbi:MAG: prepilin peptidase [Elusimicrobiota bacterium]
MLTVTLLVFVFAFGLLIGSFLNVCIARLPQALSIETPLAIDNIGIFM